MHFKDEIEVLCCEFERIPVRQAGLDALVSTFLGIKYVNRYKSLNLKSLMREVGSFVVQYVSGLFQKETVINWRPLPLVTFMSNRPHIYKMSQVLTEELNYQVNIFWTIPGVPLLTVEGTLIHKNDIRYSLRLGKERELKQAFKDGKKVFRTFLRKQGLSRLRMIPFEIHVRRQLALVRYFEEQFENTKPTAVFTEHDRFNELASLVIAARQKGIPSVTQVHGLLNSRSSYVPLVADNIGCWGNWHKQRLIDWGVSEERIKVTGAIQLSDSFQESEESRELEAGKSGTKRMIILATNPTEQVRKSLILEFCQAIESLKKDWIGVLRLHPSENRKDYSAYLTSDRIFFSEDIHKDQELIFRVSDAVVVFNSAFAIDAILKSKPVFQLRVMENMSPALEVLIEIGLIPSFNNGEKLAEAVKICGRSEFKDHFANKRKEFLENFCQYFGKRAARNFTEILNQV